METDASPLTRFWRYVDARISRLRLSLFALTLLSTASYIAFEAYTGHLDSEKLALPISLMALSLGVIQFADAWAHTRKMDGIADSVSTRYIGNFPKNLTDVCTLTKAARRELLVMVEFVNYGHYWKPEAFEEFSRELELARDRGVKVRFLAQKQDAAKQALQELLPEKELWPPKESDELYKHFFSVYPGIEKPKDYYEFLETLLRKGREAASKLFDKGVSIKLAPNSDRLFLCVEDGEEAVFSFKNAAGGEPLCFRTRDAKLIETFKDLFNGHWERGREYLPEVKEAKAAARESEIKPEPRKSGKRGIDDSGLFGHNFPPGPESPKPSQQLSGTSKIRFSTFLYSAQDVSVVQSPTCAASIS
jgi:hypothetical protein